MKLVRRQRELGFTDRGLAKAAGVSTATVYRAKRGKVSRWAQMEQLAEALEVQVRDIEEFHDAIRRRALAEAERLGAPPEVEAWADGLLGAGYEPMDREAVQEAAYSLLRDTMRFLDRAGRSDLVDKAIRDYEKGRRR
jgi:transcriptional regulator with XRE-family HTH domain